MTRCKYSWLRLDESSVNVLDDDEECMLTTEDLTEDLLSYVTNNKDLSRKKRDASSLPPRKRPFAGIGRYIGRYAP